VNYVEDAEISDSNSSTQTQEETTSTTLDTNVVNTIENNHVMDVISNPAQSEISGLEQTDSVSEDVPNNASTNETK